MAVVIYIDGATQTVTSVQPDLTNRALIELAIPNGLPVRFASTQLASLIGNLENLAGSELMVIKATIG